MFKKVLIIEYEMYVSYIGMPINLESKIKQCSDKEESIADSLRGYVGEVSLCLAYIDIIKFHLILPTEKKIYGGFKYCTQTN